MKKLLIFDLDDTLLTSEKTISKLTAEEIKRCKAKGMIIGYITSRSPRKVKTFLEDLPCDCIAYYNGASIYVGDSLIEENLIPHDTAISIINEIQRAYQDAKIGAYLEPYSYFNGEIRNIETMESQCAEITDLPYYDVQRIRVEFDENDDIQLMRFMSEDTIFYVSSVGTAIIVNKKANKEYAMKKLANWFHISLTNVIAFGDDINDLDMIKTAGTGIAMGNAIAQLKEVANYITDTNNNDGIALWISKYLCD